MEEAESTPHPAVRRATPHDFAAMAALLAELDRPELLAGTRAAARASYFYHVWRAAGMVEDGLYFTLRLEHTEGTYLKAEES